MYLCNNNNLMCIKVQNMNTYYMIFISLCEVYSLTVRCKAVRNKPGHEQKLGRGQQKAYMSFTINFISITDVHRHDVCVCKK